MGVGIYVD